MDNSSTSSVRLYELIEKHYNDSELKTLCFHLAVNYEDLGGAARADKIRELILYCQRHSLLTQLQNEVMKQRPEASELDTMQNPSGRQVPEVKADVDIDAWVEALAQSPLMQNRDARQAVIVELPAQIRNSLNDNLPTLNTQLRDLVRKCQNYENGLLSLVEAIRMLEDNSLTVKRLKALL